MSNLKNIDLFDVETPYLKDFFNSATYPWELLPKIKEHLAYLLDNLPAGYTLLKQGVIVGENVKISELATIIPPAIIGSNTEIRPCAYIRGNVIIGENCVLGNSSEFKNCILLNGVQAPHYNYVGDSILGNKSHVGAGVICSNLKSNKSSVTIKTKNGKTYPTNLRKMGAILADGADVGCNSVLNPGTVIGKNSIVYPLTAVRGVIEGGVIVKAMNDIVKIK